MGCPGSKFSNRPGQHSGSPKAGVVPNAEVAAPIPTLLAQRQLDSKPPEVREAAAVQPTPSQNPAEFVEDQAESESPRATGALEVQATTSPAGSAPVAHSLPIPASSTISPGTSPRAALPNEPSAVSTKSRLKKARTTQIGKDEVDFMVMQFFCHDDGAVAHLGRGAKESWWCVQVGRDGQPINIKLHVDRTLVSSPEVGIECNGIRVFPDDANKTKMKLREDFCQQWPFRGTVKNLGQKDVFEIRPPAHGPETDQWHLATLTRQRPDGLFEAVVCIPDGRGGVRQLSYPAVPASNIRYRASGEPLSVPERVLALQVPAHDPLHAFLCVDGHEMITHFFARPTPSLASAGEKPQVLVDVSKDREGVVLNVGHAILSHFLTSEVRLVGHSADKRKHSWTIQIGPFAEHTIEIERHWSSRLVTLTVDGERFVEACAEDLDCPHDRWECKFRFVGERLIRFNVHETNTDGDALDTKGDVTHKEKFVRECTITVYDESNFANADLVVDDVSSRDLPLRRDVHPESNLSTSVHALQAMYSVIVPFKVNEDAPRSLTAYAGAVAQSLGGLQTLVVGDGSTADRADGVHGLHRFWHCCARPASTDEHSSEIQVPVAQFDNPVHVVQR